MNVEGDICNSNDFHLEHRRSALFLKSCARLKGSLPIEIHS